MRGGDGSDGRSAGLDGADAAARVRRRWMHPVDGDGAPAEPEQPDLGDLVILLLAGTLSGVRERLLEDGFAEAAELVEDLVEVVDAYLHHLPQEQMR